MHGRQKHQPVNARDLLNATKPVVPFYSEGTDPASEKVREFIVGVFAMGAVAVSIVTYFKATKLPFLTLFPSLFAAFLIASLWSYHRNMAKIQSATAETLLGHEQDNVVNAIHKFQSETAVPPHIIIRDQISKISTSAIQLFMQCEKEGSLDSRGVLFVLSAKTGGYALVLGQGLARKTLVITPVLIAMARFEQRQYAPGLIDALNAFRPQLAQVFPRTGAPPRPAADALDIRS